MKEMTKATAVAPSNVAFIKYWGRVDEKLRIPTNTSISMNLSALTTTTTVQFDSQLEEDTVTIDGKNVPQQAYRVSRHLDRVRDIAGIKTFARVVSNNSFPASTGLSSSASGFAALTVAASAAAGLELGERELSMLARLGSGSACRSIANGIVEWHAGDSHETSYAHSLYAPDYWDIVDIVVVTSERSKKVPTSKGQRDSITNPFFQTRLAHIDKKITHIKAAMESKDFSKFGEIVESEALELHAIMMTSAPPLVYLFPETLRVIGQVQKMREEGLAVYFTLNTGHNVHVLCLKKDMQIVNSRLSHQYESSTSLLANQSGKGAHLIDDHLY